jgi:hypothetical protein
MINIKVTQKHIDKALKYYRNATIEEEVSTLEQYCPIALALKESQKKRVRVVSNDNIALNYDIYIPINNKERRKVRSFINNFDNHREVYPSKFKIRKAIQ